MIICAKYLMTGDGETVLEGQAVLTGGDGKIKKIASKEELTREFPERATVLFERNEEAAKERYEHLTRLTELYK